MFVTMVEGRVDDARELICAQLGRAGLGWLPHRSRRVLSDARWWRSVADRYVVGIEEAVMAMRARSRSRQPSRSSSKPAPDPRSRCGQMKVGPVWGNTTHREPAPRGEPWKPASC